jgi:hypothetical protein
MALMRQRARKVLGARRFQFLLAANWTAAKPSEAS